MSHAKVLKAVEFAERKHRGQTRKNAAKTPYIAHPIEVARTMAEIGGVTDVDVLAAALLHDTVEDTDTSFDELTQHFGESVARFVAEVTDDKSLPKHERKRVQVAHAKTLSAGATYIKLGDKLSNVHDVIYNAPAGWDPVRRMQYLMWAREVIDSSPDVNRVLRSKFNQLVSSGLQTILRMHDHDQQSEYVFDYATLLDEESIYSIDLHGQRSITLSDGQGTQDGNRAYISEERGDLFGGITGFVLNEVRYNFGQPGQRPTWSAEEHTTRVLKRDMGEFTFDDVSRYMLENDGTTRKFTELLHQYLSEREIVFNYS